MKTKKHEDLATIRARIAAAREKVSEWTTKHHEAMDALASAKDADFLARVQVAIDASAEGAAPVVEMPERQFMDMRSMRMVTEPARNATVVRVHRGTKHSGLWVRYEGESHVQFISAGKFAPGYGPKIDGIPYPEFQKGDQR